MRLRAGILSLVSSVVLSLAGGCGFLDYSSTADAPSAPASATAAASGTAAAPAASAATPAADVAETAAPRTPPTVVTPNRGSTSAATETAATPGPVGQIGSAWTLSFSDEFNAGTLDTSKWSDQIWYGDRNADGTRNYDFSNGALRIWPALNRSGQFFDRTFHTEGRFQQRYGYFEARMKLPRGRGPWPAFWLLGRHDGQAPYRPEIDIMEAYPGGGYETGWGTRDLRPTTYGVSFHTDRGSEATRTSAGPFKVSHPDLSADFNVYGFKWEPGGRMTWYLNGVEQGSTVFPGLDSQSMAVYLDLWFGSASGTPNLSETPTGPSNSFEIDYVRIWR